jgi:hypothetical protein
MRLFRRTLPCLVVGVTAFGVAGWMMGPKPNWEVELAGAFGNGFITEEIDTDGDEWVWIVREQSKEFPNQSLIALDPRNGRQVLKLESKAGYKDVECRRHLDGALSVKSGNEDERGRLNGSFHVALFDAADGSLRLERTLSGVGEVCRDSRIAWQLNETKNGFTVRVFDLQSNATLRELQFGKEYRWSRTYTVGVSPDATLIALPKTPLSDTHGPCIELWDIERKKLLREIAPPRDEVANVVETGHPRFSRDGGHLDYESNSRRHRDHHTGRWVWDRWTFDPKRNEHIGSDGFVPSPPPEWSDETELERLYRHEGEELWCAFHAERRCGAFAIFRDGEMRLPWRRIPYSVALTPRPWPVSQVDAAHDKDVFLVEVYGSPLDESVPESVRWLIPASWNATEITKRTIWHDWRNNEWRDVGCSKSYFDNCRRRKALLTISQKDDKPYVVRSWPLPRRDPKWPALGVAICAAGTWWVCACRYQRRTRLASVDVA